MHRFVPALPFRGLVRRPDRLVAVVVALLCLLGLLLALIALAVDLDPAAGQLGSWRWSGLAIAA